MSTNPNGVLFVLYVAVLVFSKIIGLSEGTIVTGTLTPQPVSTRTHTTSSPAAPSPSLSPTPLPSNGLSLNTYILHSTGDERVCLRMASKMTVTFQYPTPDGKMSKSVPFGETAKVNMIKSFCGLSVCAEPTSASLVIDYGDISVALNFNELEGNRHWSYNSTVVNFTITRNLFPNLSKPELYDSLTSVSSDASLFDWTLPELILGSSYACNSITTLKNFNSSVLGEFIKVSVALSELQVQAFKFESQVSFDNDYESCYADRQIVVPVAVAGALALLTTGVLMFSLIKLFIRKYKENIGGRKYVQLVNQHL